MATLLPAPGNAQLQNTLNALLRARKNVPVPQALEVIKHEVHPHVFACFCAAWALLDCSHGYWKPKLVDVGTPVKGSCRWVIVAAHEQDLVLNFAQDTTIEHDDDLGQSKICSFHIAMPRRLQALSSSAAMRMIDAARTVDAFNDWYLQVGERYLGLRVYEAFFKSWAVYHPKKPLRQRVANPLP